MTTRAGLRQAQGTFRPPPGLDNPHVQTILGRVFGGARFGRPSWRRCLRLNDGDALVYHDSAPPGWRIGERIALLLHGLGGTAASPHVGRVGRGLLARGVRVLRLNLRGAGPGAGLARRRYHGGSSDDIRAVAVDVQRWAPGSPLLLVGFSLGGNIALKLAGEAATEPVPGLARVAVLGPPIDLGRCSALLGELRNRIYDVYFMTLLLAQQRRWRRLVSGLPKYVVPRPLTMRRYDELYVAPPWGFAGADDYYQRCSSWSLIPRIPVPTLILTARDDPFIPVEPFERLKVPGHIEVRIEDRGGHLGFVGGAAAPGLTWADQCLFRWLLSGDAGR
jgi:predicted alpha/beta-fold hydrolase